MAKNEFLYELKCSICKDNKKIGSIYGFGTDIIYEKCEHCNGTGVVGINNIKIGIYNEKVMRE